MTTRRYAAETTVPAEKSRAEIEATLTRYGADAFAYGWDGPRAMIQFRHQGKYVRFVLPLPDRTDTRFTQYESRGRIYERTPLQAQKEYEQAIRQSWRALALVIKAKLEAVEAGIVTFDQEFLSHFVLPNGETFGDWAIPQLARAYELGEMPRFALLPAHEEGR